MLRRIDDSILLETPEKRKQAKDKFIKERLNLIGKYREIVDNIAKEFSGEIDNNIIKKMSNVGRIEAEKKCASIIILRGVFILLFIITSLFIKKKLIDFFCY